MSLSSGLISWTFPAFLRLYCFCKFNCSISLSRGKSSLQGLSHIYDPLSFSIEHIDDNFVLSAIVFFTRYTRTLQSWPLARLRVPSVTLKPHFLRRYSNSCMVQLKISLTNSVTAKSECLSWKMTKPFIVRSHFIWFRVLEEPRATNLSMRRATSSKLASLVVSDRFLVTQRIGCECSLIINLSKIIGGNLNTEGGFRESSGLGSRLRGSCC